jgi:hypothetical protein
MANCRGFLFVTLACQIIESGHKPQVFSAKYIIFGVGNIEECMENSIVFFLFYPKAI